MNSHCFVYIRTGVVFECTLRGFPCKGLVVGNNLYVGERMKEEESNTFAGIYRFSLDGEILVSGVLLSWLLVVACNACDATAIQLTHACIRLLSRYQGVYPYACGGVSEMTYSAETACVYALDLALQVCLLLLCCGIAHELLSD